VGADLRAQIEPLRARGASVAVDDIGAGYSGLRQITAVLPRYLKLDRSLVTGIDTDSERAALVGALAGYARQVGSLLIAEGVESHAELCEVRRLGVPLVQGFYFGRPAQPWPKLAAGVEAGGDGRPAAFDPRPGSSGIEEVLEGGRAVSEVAPERPLPTASREAHRVSRSPLG
jgi:EAL domain-containing protein (putative c-di-GMP-specific phosphodiesterase class I)